ncbi:ATPase family AAA domain-containing protein 5b [Garra rufa]|uniref:ATPase family AAA domain-containing protein 5b n=1 Tax=Garra rufa TaxID=137080 RepID=UPI003CCE9D99
METPSFLPQHTRIKKSSGSVFVRKAFYAENLLEMDSRPKTQVHPKHNRLKRAKTQKTTEDFTGCGNNLTHLTETSESRSFCDVILNNCKGKRFTDDASSTDDKDSSALPTSPEIPTTSLRKEGHHSQTVQKISQMQNEVSTNRSKLTLKRMSSNMSLQIVPIPAERERGSSDKSLKPNFDNFRADKQVLSSCLQINTSDTDLLMDQPEVNNGQIPESTKHGTGQALTLITSLSAQHICRESTNVKPLEMKSGWGNEFGTEISSELLEEIQMLNLQFPIHTFFTLLLRKRTAPEEDVSAWEADKTDDSKHLSASVQRKRKQQSEEQMCDRTCKRHRTNKGCISAEKLDFEQFSDGLANSHAKYTNRLSRTKRRQQQTTFCAVVTEPEENKSVHQDAWPSRLRREDVLWTDKYQPQQSSEVIGNSESVGQLHSWLKEWKIRADTEERRRRKEERRMKKETVEMWDCGDFEGDTVSKDNEQELCNTMLMIGPSGVGKTAAVYACAQELGFKVFEVNSSALRCGRLILSQLTEATRSHQVDIHRIKTFKSEIINQSKIKPDLPCDTDFYLFSTGKEGHRKVPLSFKKTSSSPNISRLSTKPQPVKLTRFFKLSSRKSVGKTSDGPEHYIHAIELKPDRLERSVSGFEDNRQDDQESTCPSKGPTSAGQGQTVPMSLILFEEVDVIFPEDVGFLAAIRTFMSTTKRPIVLTTNDPSFRGRLKGHFEEIHFQTPSLQTIRSYLQCLCLVENVRTDPEDVAFLLCQNKGDIRQSILQLQLWVCSGGGSTELQILKNILKCVSWTELENSMYLEILAEKMGAGLLYSNIESLFSPHFLSQSSYQQQSINSKTKEEKPIKSLMLQTSTSAHEVRPDKLSTCRRKKHLSSCEPKTFSSPHSTPHLKLFSLGESCKSSVPTKQTKDVHGQDKSLMLLFQHMVCIAKFFENMSFLDACLQRSSVRGTGLCKPEPLGWMGAKVKDGLLDLSREEQIGQCFESSSQILSIVEGLSFHQCRTELSGIWMEAERLKLSSERWEEMIGALSLPSDKKNLRMCRCEFCEPSGAQKRNEIVSNLISSKKFYCHSNKHVLSMDYLPTLRSICRSERVKEQHSLRHSHYLTSLHLPKSLLELMALDFP